MAENVTLKSETPRVSASGLDNVVAAETALSHVDGEAGRLIVAGYDVEELVKAYDFEGA
ncbi:MAG: citrate synthase/methylcitrate synthase, partial [Parvibaculum sp.]